MSGARRGGPVSVSRTRVTSRLASVPLLAPGNASSTLPQTAHAGADTSPVQRRDNRAASSWRPSFLSTGVVAAAHGSSYVELAGTRVMAAVYGPRQTGRGNVSTTHGLLQCDVRFARFTPSHASSVGQASPQEREASLLVAQALECSVLLHRFPKALVDVYVMVLQDDGAALAACITAGSLALADAGIEVYDLVPACAVASLPAPQALVLDPTAAEEAAAQGVVTAAAMPSLAQLTQLSQSSGQLSADVSIAAMDMALDGCNSLYQEMRQALLKRMQSQQAARGGGDGGV